MEEREREIKKMKKNVVDKVKIKCFRLSIQKYFDSIFTKERMKEEKKKEK